MGTKYTCPSCAVNIPFQPFQAGTQCICPSCGKPSKAPDPESPSGDGGGASATPVGVGSGSGFNASAQAGGGLNNSGFGGAPATFPQQPGGFGGGFTQEALPSVDTLAGLGARLGAALIDFACVAGIYLIFFLMVGAPGTTGFDETAMGAGFVLLLGAILVLVIAQVYLLTTCGQTIGKKIVGIKIVCYDDGSEGGFVKNVLMRGFVNGLISAIPFLGSIYALVDILFIFGQERRCIHDLIAGTKVINA